jgi:hypothetical protein
LNSRGLGFPDSSSGELWYHPRLKTYDSEWKTVIPYENGPLHRASLRAEVFEEAVLGWENAVTGERYLVRMSALPLHDESGKHRGGMLRFTDVTERERQQNKEVQAKGEEYFKLVCDSMPQLVWTTLANGYHGVYRRSSINR